MFRFKVSFSFSLVLVCYLDRFTVYGPEGTVSFATPTYTISHTHMFKTISNWVQAIFCASTAPADHCFCYGLAGSSTNSLSRGKILLSLVLALMMVRCGPPRLFTRHTVGLTEFSISDWRMGQWQTIPLPPTSSGSACEPVVWLYTENHQWWTLLVLPVLVADACTMTALGKWSWKFRHCLNSLLVLPPLPWLEVWKRHSWYLVKTTMFQGGENTTWKKSLLLGCWRKRQARVRATALADCVSSNTPADS
jgi:hypothetical protein